MTTKPKVLPIKVMYSDKVDLIKKMLNMYSMVVEKLTPRNIDLITLIILYGVNSPDFRKTIVEANLFGFSNEKHINTELSRLKKDGFLRKHSVKNEKYLSKGLEQIEILINSEQDISVYLEYEKLPPKRG